METPAWLDDVTRGATDLGGSGAPEMEDTPWGEQESLEEPEGRGLRAVVGGVLLLLIVSTLLGNTLVCAAVVKFRHLRCKVTNVFVVSLAVSDLLLALLVMPWEALAAVTGRWLLGGFCSAWIACDIMCSTASILNLCVISLDRYWAISSPFRYERRMTHRAALLMIALAWTLSLLISFVPVHLGWHLAGAGAGAESGAGAGAEAGEAEEGWGYRNRTAAAAAAAEGCVANLSKAYAIASSLVSFYIPVAVMLATYTRIYRIAQTQIRRIAALERAAGAGGAGGAGGENPLRASFRKESKVLKTLSVIMGVFVCCWSPFFLLNCTVPFCTPPCVSDTTFTVAVWFGWANSSLNPVIYAFNADFRRAFSSLLGCGRLFPGNAVEQAVNLSDELASYHRRRPRPPAAAAAASDPAASDSGAASNGVSSASSSRGHKELLMLPSVVPPAGAAAPASP